MPTLVVLGVVVGAMIGAVPERAHAQAWEPFNGVRQTQTTRHALVHADLVPGPGERIEDATIVIEGGVITRVEAGGEAPAGFRVWDCTGLTVYPGLVEAWLPVEAPSVDPGVTGAHWNTRVQAQRSVLDSAGVSASQREKLRGMGFCVAHIAPDDQLLRGTSAVVSLGDPVSEAEPVARVVRERVAHVASLDGGRGGGYPNSKMGAIALIRQTLADVPWLEAASAAYAEGVDGVGRPAPNGAVEALGEDLPIVWDTGNDLDVLRTGKIAREFGRDWFIVGSGQEYQRIGPIVEEGRAIIVPLDFPKAPQVATPSDREAVELRTLMAWEQAPTNARRLDDAGVNVMLTSSKLDAKQSFEKNLRKAIETGGLSEDVALAMLTTRPAELLGVGDRVGRVAAGYPANIVTVADGGLFDEKREVRDVWVDGVRHEVNAAPRVDMKGEWSVVFGAPVDVSATLKIAKGGKLSIEREVVDEAVEAAVEEPIAGQGAVNDAAADAAAEEAADDDAPAKPKTKKVGTKSVSIVENRIAFVSTDDEVFAEGATMLSAIREGDRLIGEGELPDGTRFEWTGAPTPEGEADGEDDDEEGDEDDSDAEEGSDAAGDDIPDIAGYPFGAFAYAEPPTQRPILITNATIWTSGPDGILENAAMLVSREGKVERVWSGPVDVAMPSDGITIDARGKHITPGLIDCHSHTGISGGVNEGTQSCTSEVRIFDVIDPDNIGWYRELAGGLTMANQLHGSANAIGGQNSVVKLRWGSAHPDAMRMEGAPGGIKFALGENVKQSNWGPENNTRYPQTRMGVETFIRDRFTAAREYARSSLRSDLPIAPRRDLELEALAEILAGSRLIHCHSYRQDEILMLCRVAGDFGFKIGTFQHVLEGYKVAEAIREHARGGSAFSDWWAYKQEVIDAIPYAGAIMHEVGVTVSFNSDDNELARRMNTEAAKAVKYGGVDRAEALKFVTLNPAIQLGIEDRVGSLEAGKDADFVIWSGDPLSTLSRCERTFIDGREYFSIERDAELRAAAKAERNRLIQKVLTEGDKKKRPAGEEDPDKPGESEDAPGRPGLGAAFVADMRAGGGGGRMLIIPPDAEGELAAIRADEQAQRLEIYFNWMILNGMDPNISRPGDCGCGIQALQQGL